MRLRSDPALKLSPQYGVFRSTVLHQFHNILAKLGESIFTTGGIGKDELNRQADLFMNNIDDAFQLASQNVTQRRKNPLFSNLREAFVLRDLKGLAHEIQFSFQSFVLQQRSLKGTEKSQKQLVDFRFPHEWYPATRAVQRTIHIHVGPTNSGKTYNALQALERSRSGLYCGPLRLLANEIYQRLNAKGRPTALWTGEQIRIPEKTDRYFTSCTVEMAPMNKLYDVAVIDEIQMIGNAERGDAWTAALLGIQAKEVHVCGEERAVNIVQAICASVGDKVVVHHYNRLSPLEVMEKSIDGDFKKLQKGDAVVAFSRVNLHALKRRIETQTGRRCAIVYGALPPEVRVQQAALFNEPDNDYDFIVASDAIGMGLNLEIRRVVFESVVKFDGTQQRVLDTWELKQIGGRAGRYRTARTETSGESEDVEKIGLVTSMDHQDLNVVQDAFDTNPKDIKQAYVSPPPGIIERFASFYPPDTPLSFLLLRLRDAATVSSLYNLHVDANRLENCDAIQDIPLTIFDKITFSNAPVSLRMPGFRSVYRAMAKAVALNTSGHLLDIPEIPLEVLDTEVIGPPSPDYLLRLESLHTAITLYTWLSYRYPSVFISQDMAFEVRSLAEEKLMKALETLDFSDEAMLTRRRMTRKQAALAQKQKRAIDGGHRQKAEPEVVVDRKDDTPPLGVEETRRVRVAA